MPRKATDEYLAAFEKVAWRSSELEEEVGRERLRAEGLLGALARLPPENRMETVRRERRFQSWVFFDRLLQESREAGFRDPAEATELARLALAVLERLDRRRYPAGLAGDWRAEAFGALGNARRLASDFEEAGEFLAEALEALEEGTGDATDRAALISLEASLESDAGERSEAVRMLDRAIRLFSAAENGAMVAHTRLKQASFFGHIDPQEGVKRTIEASFLIDSDEHPRLALCAQHNLAWCLNDVGKPQEALATLEEAHSLYRRFPDAWAQLRLRWLEGRISRRLGDLAGAERTFRQCAAAFQRRKLHMEHALISADLAEALAAQQG